MSEYTDMLEGLIDRHGLRHVIDSLAVICFAKGEHLRSNWQDENTAKLWERAGRACDRFAGHAAILTLTP